MSKTITLVKKTNQTNGNISDKTKDDLYDETVQHIRDVSNGLKLIEDLIEDREELHDASKLSNFNRFFNALTSGKIKDSEWYKTHITQERHHLKAHVPDDVNLIDVIEHIVDCTMAGLVRGGGIHDIDISPEVLVKACENTSKLIQDSCIVIEIDESKQRSDDLKDAITSVDSNSGN